MNDLAVRSVKDNIIENGEKRILAMQTEIESLRATQERMWCKSCGTVTRTRECDCTRMETGTQRLVNYADSLQNDIDDLRATEARLRAALKQALRQWNMYAEMVERNDGFDLATEKSPEAEMYRAAYELAHACEQKAEDAAPADKR